MIQVIEDKKGWDDFIASFEESDLYHTFDYHNISKGDGRPVLLKYSHGKISIGMPLLIRKIPNTTFYDATSVYGYVGPLHKNITADFDNRHFQNELLDYLTSHNIVSVFSRLNPFLPLQNKVLENIGVIEKKGPIVSIDLKKNIDIQRQEFRRRLKGQLNKARRFCTVKKASSKEDFQDFIEIYHENMDRVRAKPMYYFDDHYFNMLLDSGSFHTETLLAIHNDSGKVIGACMFFFKNSVIHYHLSGTKSEYLPLMPTKLLIDEMRIKASHLGLSHFNLGGGLSGSNDNLLQFKSSFSKNMIDFNVWKLIVRPMIYNKISEEGSKLNKVDFFPIYRYNDDKLIMQND